MKSTVVLVISVLVAIGVVALAFVNKPEPDVELPVLVEEYADLNCPHCRDFQPTMNSLRAEFEGNEDVKFEFVNNPILGTSSEQAAFAVEAAGNQDKRDEYISVLYENFEARSDEDYEAFAEELGLDVERFNSDRENSDLQQRVLDKLAENREKGITSTPTLVINGKTQVARDLESLIEEINELIEIGKRQNS